MLDITEFYNHHYIRTDANGYVAEGWSDGPHNNRVPDENDICINDKGGYQFRLIIDGESTEENPALYGGEAMRPLYRWDGERVVRRSAEELEAECEAYRAAAALQMRIAELKNHLYNTDYVAAKIAEGAATREDYADMLAQRQRWRDEINALAGEGEVGNDGR